MHFSATKRGYFAAILFFGLLAMTARTAVDPDLWWHLRTGEWILEHHAVPHSDSFSFTRADAQWVSHEWLSEVTFFALWKSGGPAALIIFSSIITTIGFLFLYFRCPTEPHWAAAATVIGALASAPCWGTRPQMFTFALASLLLWLLNRAEHFPRCLLCIPPLFLLWLNLHAGFALGPALLTLYTLGLGVEVATGRTAWGEARRIILRVAAVTLVCLALVPLNPSGAQLYAYPFDTIRSSAMRTYIVEWFSPDFHHLLYAPLMFVFFLLLAALASKISVKGRVLLPLLFTAFAALDAVRHIPIFILLAIPVIASAIPARFRSTDLRPSRNLRTFYLSSTVVLLAVFALLRWVALAHAQSDDEAESYPERAVEYLRNNREPANVFAYYDWGGYVLWKLAPQYRIFFDGRADLYGDDLLRQGLKTVTEIQQGWKAVLREYNVQTVMVPPASKLAQALLLDRDWRICYRDPQAVLFIRTPPVIPARQTVSSPFASL